MIVDLATLRAVLSYDPETGVFLWKMDRNRARAGNVAGTIMSHGYVRICIARRMYYAHRLVWLYVHGHMPVAEIDHVNGDRSDNRLCNLRPASRHENGANISKKRNNTSGVPGVSWEKKLNKWAAYIHPSRHKIHLGYFDTIEDAANARKSAERRIFGEFARAA